MRKLSDSASGPVRLGLLGFGRIAERVHLHALARSPRIELVAVAESDDERRMKLEQRKPQFRTFSHSDEVLALPEIEAVLVCLPNELHAPAAKASFEAGKHVYLEKPIATNLKAGRDVVAAWKASERVGMIGFNYRYNPLYTGLREAITQSRIGEPILIRSAFSSPARELPSWKRARALGGGVLLDFASHHVDLVRFLTGVEIRTVTANVRSLSTDEDTANLQLELENGITVQSFFSTSAVEQDRFEVMGSKGTLRFDRLRSKRLAFEPAQRPTGRVARSIREFASLTKLPSRLLSAIHSDQEPSFDACLANFASAIRGGSVPAPDLTDGLRSLEVIAAAEESARSGIVASISPNSAS